MTLEELYSMPLSENKIAELYPKYFEMMEKEPDTERRNELYDICDYLYEKQMSIQMLNEDLKEQFANSDEYKQMQVELNQLCIANAVIMQKVAQNDIQQLGKKDLMRIFDKEEDWVLNLMRFMCQQEFAIRINREYYTTKDDLEKFMSTYKGTMVKINTR